MGEAIARTLGEQGARIILTWHRSRQAVEKSAAELRALGIDAETLPCDVTRDASLSKLIRTIGQRYHRLDVLVYMASNYQRSNISGKGLAKSWDVHLNTDARGAYLITAAAARLLKSSGGGRVILISDWLSASGRPRYTEYSEYYIAKATVKAATEALALQLAPGILVNAIAPGPTLPPKSMSAKEYNAVKEVTPLRRWGGAEEIAKAVKFLCETDFVTGETIRVDGGRHLY